MGLYILIATIILIVSVVLILVVLIQNSKGGGLSSTFASSNQIMGVRKTADFLEKTTWTLAIALLALSMLSIFVIPKNKANVKDTELREQLDKNASAPLKNVPAPPPAEKK